MWFCAPVMRKYTAPDLAVILCRKGQGPLRSIIHEMGRLAYLFIIARNFVTALEAADQAISLAPDKLWLYTNRAHALMFLGRADEARTIYLRFRGQSDAGHKKLWEVLNVEDFAEFRKAVRGGGMKAGTGART
jgi:hypothetical protein